MERLQVAAVALADDDRAVRSHLGAAALKLDRILLHCSRSDAGHASQSAPTVAPEVSLLAEVSS